MSEVSEFITIIRPKFMRFCKDACRAATLNHLLFRIAYKCKDQPKEKIQNGDIMWYATNEQITTEMSNAWGVCKVRKEVNVLVEMGLAGRRSNPAWGMDRTKHFFFGKEQCQKFIQLCEESNICIVHLDLPPEVVHLIYSSNANDKSIKCSCPEPVANDKSIGCKSLNHQMQVIDSSDAFDKSIEALTKNTTKINYKDNTEERDTSDAVAFAPHHDTSTSFSQGSSSQFSTQANAVENPGQLADSMTVSQPRDNGVREALDPLSASERVNTSHDVESHRSASTDTPSKASDLIAALATRNPDEEQATLSQSGENATAGNGDTPTESGAQEEAPTKRARKPAQPKQAKPTPPPIVLSTEEQAFYDLYCSMPMIKIKPDITAKVKEQCGKLAPHLKTREEVFKLKNWMKKDQYFKDKGFKLPMLVLALNDWAMTQEPVDLEEKRNEVHKDAFVNIGTNITQVVRPKETELERHNREMRERYTGKKVVGR